MSPSAGAEADQVDEEIASQPDVLADGTGAHCFSELFLCFLNDLVEAGINQKIVADSLPEASPPAAEVMQCVDHDPTTTIAFNPNLARRSCLGRPRQKGTFSVGFGRSTIPAS